MKCNVREYSDKTRCETCGLEWESNSPFEPTCTMQKLAAYHAQDGARAALEAARKSYLRLELAAVSLGVLVFLASLLRCAP